MTNVSQTVARIAALCALLAWSAPAHAQSFVLNNTTLNGAITATQNTLILTSASALSGSSFGAPAAGQCLFVGAELMRIVSIASTTVTVTRGTPAVAHPTLSVLYTGSCNAFQQAEPPVANWATTGGQSCSTQPRPWINVKTANVWFCNTVTNAWRGTNYATFSYGSVPVGQ